MVVLLLNFLGTSILFSIVPVPIYIRTKSVEGFSFLLMSTLVIYCLFGDSHSNKYLTIVLICIPLTVPYAKKPFMYLLVICITSLKKCLFTLSLPIFKLDPLCLLLYEF